MAFIFTNDYVESLVESHVSRTVFASPSFMVFETPSQEDSDKCVELLHKFYAYPVFNAGHYFVCTPTTRHA